MADSFHVYLKKQLVDYIEAERKKGVPLETIETSLLNAGHDKNIIDEVVSDLKKEELGKKVPEKKDPVENDIMGMLKKSFSQFMAQSKGKEIDDAKEDIKKTGTEEIVEEAIEEAEVIEEKTMLESLVFFIYLVALGVVIVFAAGSSGSEIVNVALGFIPIIINAFVSFFALKYADNVPLYMFIPLGICSAFDALGKFANLGFFSQMDIDALSLVNFLGAFVFNVMIVYVRFVKPNHMKKKVIKKNKNVQQPFAPNVDYIHAQKELKRREEIEELRKGV
jgi:hypothetical protein